MADLKRILEDLKSLDDEYFKKFMEFYPLYLTKEKEGIFGPSELFEMAISAQVLLTELGDTAIARMKYLGFDLMYPFDNPVDWFNWKEEIQKNNVPQSVYFSISLRMSSEFNRMFQHVERDTWDVYCQLSGNEFLVSKERYKEHFVADKEIESPISSGLEAAVDTRPHVHIDNFHYSQEVEKEAVDNLDRLQKHSSIWSNAINVATKLLGIKI
jgi:hypothetical protein